MTIEEIVIFMIKIIIIIIVIIIIIIIIIIITHGHTQKNRYVDNTFLTDQYYRLPKHLQNLMLAAAINILIKDHSCSFYNYYTRGYKGHFRKQNRDFCSNFKLSCN